ncbi:hypothetical protein N0V95_003113 [Ascochyta clinopodiicola]|nr:hypothetical protein N0V95_003113 [Ascochyta clinopodiicola]
MVDLIAAVQKETDDAVSEETLIQILRTTYPDALVALHSSKAGHIEAEGRGPVPLLDLSDGLWEDSDYIDEFIARSNHRELPTDRVVRIITAQCEGVSGQLYLTVATKDFRLVFDDIDAWFVQTCAGIVSRVWHRHLLAEVMVAKEKFLRGFSHQLRTPIHGILGSVELLAEDLKSRNSSATISQAAALLQATSVTKADGNHRIYLDTIKRAGRDLISIVNSMITLNRWADVAKTDRQYATYTIYELETELANKTQEAIAGDERYHASLFFNHNLPPDYCSLQTDLGLLRDSLLPVIINAIQSTMEGVVAVTISVRPNDNELVVDVTDTGHGIPHDDHQRIFELYEQVDVYSTGSGLGLTLASKFAALLDGSIDLISSEMGRGSHFRATFHNVELTHLQDEPTVSQLANLPQRFHPVSSGSKALSLCDHFAKFLTCHGFASSDDMNDSFVVVDFVADPEQRRTVLSQLPQDQVVICLVPFSEEESHIDDTLLNVVYVHSPFSTGTMSSALEHADSLMPRLKATLVDPVQATRGLVVLSKLDRSMNKTGLYSEIEDTRRVVGISDTNQASITHEEAIANQVHTAPESSKLVRPTHSENSSAAKAEVLADSLNFRTTQRPTRPNDDSLTNVHLDSATLAIAKTEQDAPLELEMSQSAQTFPDPANSSHPTALLVDDNVINLRVMQMYCDKRNLLYVCAKDGLEAVSVFASHQNSISCGSTKSPIQLILMDLQMPGCDGIEATRRIRRLEEERNWGKSVLFIVTGQDSPADRAGAESAGSQEFYVKPVGIKTYDAGLKQYFPRFEARSQLP